MSIGFGKLPKQYHQEIEEKPVNENGLILQREEDGRPRVNVPRVVVKYDTTGFDFGNHKPKSKELAINALHHCMKAAGYMGQVAAYNGRAFYMAHRHHEAFGQIFIFKAPERGKVVPWADILWWLRLRGLAGEGSS